MVKQTKRKSSNWEAIDVFDDPYRARDALSDMQQVGGKSNYKLKQNSAGNDVLYQKLSQSKPKKRVTKRRKRSR